MTIAELADDIITWHIKTFGEYSEDQMYSKVSEEMDEFIDDPCDEEAADVIIALFAWSFRKGSDLPSVLLTKWNEVKSRTNQPERDAERGILI